MDRRKLYLGGLIMLLLVVGIIAGAEALNIYAQRKAYKIANEEYKMWTPEEPGDENVDILSSQKNSFYTPPKRDYLKDPCRCRKCKGQRRKQMQEQAKKMAQAIKAAEAHSFNLFQQTSDE